MHIPNFTIQAKKRYPYCVIEKPADDSEIAKAEERLGVSIPDQVKDFYHACNGIKFHEPFLRVLPLAEWEFSTQKDRLIFCIIGDDEKIAFDTSVRNRADQWTLIGLSENREITFTMASFWSSKIWRWLDQGRPIWSDQEYNP